MTAARIVGDPPRERDGVVRLGARLVEPDGTETPLWWEGPAEHLTPSDRMDAWLIGLLFPIMQRQRNVHVEGEVSPSLLANLELLMEVWRVWRPDRSRPAAITADAETEAAAAPSGAAVAAFSTGLDSCFTIYRHHRGLVGRRTASVGLGVFLCGFHTDGESAAARRRDREALRDATAALGGLGIACVGLSGNFHTLDVDWLHDALGSQIGSALTLVGAGRFSRALVANSVRYDGLEGEPKGNHPTNMTLMGSDRFAIVDDGGECSRFAKARLVGAWADGMEGLRVCQERGFADGRKNCGRCEKCVRRALQFHIAGVDPPASLADGLSLERIRRLRGPPPEIRGIWEDIAARLRANGDAALARAAAGVVRRSRFRTARKRLRARLARRVG